MPSRRNFLLRAAEAGAAALLTPAAFAQLHSSGANAALEVRVDADRPLATMPGDFIGLSYETSQLADPQMFAPDNGELIQLVRTLGLRGVLRIGGNSSDFAVWDAEGGTRPGGRHGARVTRQAIRNLRGFLEQTGWQAIYGLNLKTGSVEEAVSQARFVSQTLGRMLLAFQIGNEPDLMPLDPQHSDPRHRWSFAEYWMKWKHYHDAVQRAVPEADFAGPDVAYKYRWLVDMAERCPDLRFLSGHYYAEGPPADPRMNIEFLLRRGRFGKTAGLELVNQAVCALKRPFRMTEGNSCYGGGKWGVSNTYASALWGADYLLQLAQAQVIGVNLHGGGQGAYTPIATNRGRHSSARPLYYGMLFAKEFIGRTLVQCTVGSQAQQQNLVAYAGVDGPGRFAIGLINKAAETVNVRVLGLPQSPSSRRLQLKGPAIDSTDGVQFGKRSVNASQPFQPQFNPAPSITNGSLLLQVEPYSALVIES